MAAGATSRTSTSLSMNASAPEIRLEISKTLPPAKCQHLSKLFEGWTGRMLLQISRAEEGAHRFVQLLLARYIADEAIRRYRDAHQDPVLERASTYLALLTNGECTKVGVDEDQKKGPLISALYGTGEEKQVLELSSGTRDALYFALRLAAIEESIARIGPMPILLDDVLVNFDDDRSMAALRCLAEIASNTQVLLFTHHRHMISLATEALPPKGYVVHELEKRHAVVSTD
jgi:uncharacterized protein YhaN